VHLIDVVMMAESERARSRDFTGPVMPAQTSAERTPSTCARSSPPPRTSCNVFSAAKLAASARIKGSRTDPFPASMAGHDGSGCSVSALPLRALAA